MNQSFQGILLFLGFFLINVSLQAQQGSYISLKQQTEILENKKKISKKRKMLKKKLHSIRLLLYVMWIEMIGWNGMEWNGMR